MIRHFENRQGEGPGDEVVRARDFPKHERMRIAILVQGCEKPPSTLNFSKTSRKDYPQNFRKHKRDQDRPTQQKLSKSVS